MTGLSVRGLTLAEGAPARLVAEDVSFSAPLGEVTALLGGQGAGKTMLLAGIAGLLKPVRGSVLVNSVDVTAARPGKRGVFLLPPGTDLGASRGVAAALGRVAGKSGAGKSGAGRVAELLDIFGLSSLADAKLATLTHGQGFAVLAAARLLGQGDVLLVDEAGTGLDGAASGALMAFLFRLAGEGRTIVLATRAAEIALAASHLVLLRNGQVLQAGAPASVYAEPRDEHAARLTGPVNILTGVVRQKVPGGFIWAGGGRKFSQLGAGPALGGEIALYLRPEQLRAAPLDGEGNCIEGAVARIVCLGGRTRSTIDTALGPLLIDTSGPAQLRIGQRVAASWAANAAWLPWGNEPRGAAGIVTAPVATMAGIERLPTSV